MSRVFANGQCSIPKIQKMVLDDFLLNTQHYKVRIKGKVEQSRESSSALSFGSPSTKVANFTCLQYIYIYIYILPYWLFLSRPILYVK